MLQITEPFRVERLDETEVTQVIFADGSYITRAPGLGDFRACTPAGEVVWAGSELEGAFNSLELWRALSLPEAVIG